MVDPPLFLCYTHGMIKNILILLTVFAVMGCSSRPIKTIQYDGDYIIAARTKQVEVQAEHTYPFQKDKDVWVDVWLIRLVNNHKDKDWCASIDWRSMDYSIKVPNVWFYIPAYSTMNIGSVVQKTWELSIGTVTIDDSTFAVHRLNLLKPQDGRCVINER